MAASFSAWAPAFLQHKADSELEREEALGLARLLQATPPENVDEAQTSAALCLAQNVLGHLLEALDDAADHVADAEARAEHAESVVSSAHLPVSDATARRISSRFSSHIFCIAFSCCFRHAAAFVLPLANVLRSVERIAG